MAFHLSVSEDLISTVPSISTKRYTCAMEKTLLGLTPKALSSTGQSRAMFSKEPKAYISPR